MKSAKPVSSAEQLGRLEFAGIIQSFLELLVVARHLGQGSFKAFLVVLQFSDLLFVPKLVLFLESLVVDFESFNFATQQLAVSLQAQVLVVLAFQLLSQLLLIGKFLPQLFDIGLLCLQLLPQLLNLCVLGSLDFFFGDYHCNFPVLLGARPQSLELLFESTVFQFNLLGFRFGGQLLALGCLQLVLQPCVAGLGQPELLLEVLYLLKLLLG